MGLIELENIWKKFQGEVNGDGYETSPTEFIISHFEFNQEEGEETSEEVMVEFLKNHGVEPKDRKWLMDYLYRRKSDEELLLDMCVQYCYNLSVDDEDGGMMQIMFGGLGEGHIFECFERLSQKHDIYLDEASPGRR